MELEAIIITLGYLGIFLLMITNGVTMFPSSQALYIISGYFVFTGDLVWGAVALAGALGNTIGTIILYELVRRKGLEYILRFKIFPEKEIRKVQVAFHRKGLWFLFVGKLLPAIKVFVPIVAAIGKADRIPYIAIMFVTSLIWTIPFMSIGYIFGKSSDVFGIYAVILMVVALLVIAGFYKYINSEEVLQEVQDEASKNNQD
jgi:alkaline phosphatase